MEEKAQEPLVFFLPQQADKPNSVVGDHLSRPSITLRLKPFDYSQGNSELLFSLDFARDRPTKNMIAL